MVLGGCRSFLLSVTTAEYLLNSICIRMLHQIIFVPLTQLNLYSRATTTLLILEEERCRVLSFVFLASLFVPFKAYKS